MDFTGLQGFLAGGFTDFRAVTLRFRVRVSACPERSGGGKPQEHSYGELSKLPGDSIVVDGGMNLGLFSAWAESASRGKGQR